MWRGYSTDDFTWEPLRNLHSCEPLISKFEAYRGEETTKNSKRNKETSRSKRRSRRNIKNKAYRTPESETSPKIRFPSPQGLSPDSRTVNVESTDNEDP